MTISLTFLIDEVRLFMFKYACIKAGGIMVYQIKKNADRKYTWQDYLTWSDEERWEVIDGVAYDMSPSPTPRHQIIAGNIYRILGNNLHGKPCRPLIAPLDVYLDDFNFVQPDVMIVCDKEKIKDRIYGPPDLVIEVLSPSTSLKDKRIKKSLYERFCVKEYILVHPEEMFIERYSLIESKYREPDIFGPQEVLNLTSVEGIDISLWEVFEVSPPETEASK